MTIRLDKMGAMELADDIIQAPEELPVYDLTICIARTGALELGDAINHSLLE